MPKYSYTFYPLKVVAILIANIYASYADKMFERISPSHPHSFYWIFELVICYHVRDSPLANELNLRFIGISRLK